MTTMLKKLESPSLISFILVLPFIILEWVNRRDFHEGFPVVLFGLMWLIPVVFMLILMPVIRNARAGNSIMTNPMPLFIRVAFLVFITIVWTNILIDQMPCFLGVPFCD